MACNMQYQVTPASAATSREAQKAELKQMRTNMYWLTYDLYNVPFLKSDVLVDAGTKDRTLSLL